MNTKGALMDENNPGSHLPDDRRELIVQNLANSGSIRVADLAEQFSVTPVTIRRDLNLLQKQGTVIRVHGGVSLNPKVSTTPCPSSLKSPLPIGMVVPSLDYYWPSVARGAEERASTLGMKIVLRKSAYGSLEEDRIQIEHLVDHVGVKGLLLTINISAPGSTDLLQWVADKEVPTVLVERQGFYQATGDPVESVVSDHPTGAVVAIKHLLDLGHEKIGFVIGRDSPTGKQLRGSWSQASEKFGIDPEPAFFAALDNQNPQVLEHQIDTIIDDCLSTGATAVVIHADLEANALVQHCQLRGLKVPQDLSVVAYDDEVASMFTPALTAVRPPRKSLGESAVDLLAGRISSPSRPMHRLVLNPRLSIRESTAAPRKNQGTAVD